MKSEVSEPFHWKSAFACNLFFGNKGENCCIIATVTPVSRFLVIAAFFCLFFGRTTDSAAGSNTGVDRLLVELYDGKSLANISASACVGFLTLLIMFSAAEGKEFLDVF